MNRLLSILLLFSLAFCFGEVKAQDAQQGVKVIVIDAGHGGCFPGARYGGYAEKNINLQMALKLGAMIEKNMPHIKVVYTRKTEKHFSENLRTDLQARADIANKAGGDLFISIHANAHRNTGIRGVETLIMGESELETSENEAILFANNKEEFLDMSDAGTAAIVRAHIQNLQFTYGEYSEVMARLVQKHYGKLSRNNRGIRKQPLRVLYATDMPSILTEIGFMSNAAELKYITSEQGQKELVTALYNAVKEYVEYVRKSVLVDTSAESVEQTPAPKPEQKPAPKPEQKPEKKPAQKPQEQPKPQPKPKPQPQQQAKSQQSAVRYAVQVMASKSEVSVNDSRFGSYKGKVRQVRAEGAYSYKYCVGDYADRAAAQATVASVRKVFPQAFVIAVKDGKVVTKK
ncbi:MAG: N-acetylmuramoyl-L-alanine amidase [Alistipes sp.]|nr:N-acetylmuramoyl-L-alanine amidase [Alistipes sp.]